MCVFEFIVCIMKACVLLIKVTFPVPVPQHWS